MKWEELKVEDNRDENGKTEQHLEKSRYCPTQLSPLATPILELRTPVGTDERYNRLYVVTAMSRYYFTSNCRGQRKCILCYFYLV